MANKHTIKAMQKCTFTTQILTLQQYIDEIDLVCTSEYDAIQQLLNTFGVVATHYVRTYMFNTSNGDYLGRCFCAISTTYADAVAYTQNTLIAENINSSGEII